MRSLLLLSREAVLRADGLSRTAWDVGTSTLYALSTHETQDGELTLKLSSSSSNSGQTTQLFEWSTFATPGRKGKVVSLKYRIAEDDLLAVLSNGEIERIALDGEGRENMGVVDAGIEAAEWSPDEELLVLVLGDGKLVLMTRELEVVSEGPLETAAFGDDAPVNLGWGSKATQFHGSAGKAAAQAGSSADLDRAPTADDSEDDGLPRISWRGDGQFFAVSSLDIGGQRKVRIYSRTGGLSSTCEFTPGQQGPLSWQPAGSLIACTALGKGEGPLASERVVFFERNGLRRSEFELRLPSATVQELCWNADSSLLAVWLRDRESNKETVQVWHRNNYHWYLKQSYSSFTSTLISVAFHPEDPLSLNLTSTSEVTIFSLSWETLRRPGGSDGLVAVTDGAATLLTPFRYNGTPPPMAAYTIPSSSDCAARVPVQVAFAASGSTFVRAYEDGSLEVWKWELDETKKGKKKALIGEPARCSACGAVEEQTFVRQAAVLPQADSTTVVALLGQNGDGRQVLDIVTIVGGEATRGRIKVPAVVRRLADDGGRFLLHTAEGDVLEVDAEAGSVLPSEVYESLPEFCPHVEIWHGNAIGQTASGRLYAGSRRIATDSTSFFATDDFLVYTTSSHEVKFLSWKAFNDDGEAAVHKLLNRPESAAEKDKKEGEERLPRRAVERGAVIVTVVPSDNTLVLQMPRGNLETICPRPLVLRVVETDLEKLRYKAAFMSCRRHRIDLNVLHDRNPALLKQNISRFVDQVKDVDHLNLFLTALRNDDVTLSMYKGLVGRPAESTSSLTHTNKVNEICACVRSELEKRDVFQYANTVLTSYVRQEPADYESALRLLAQLKARDAERAEDAVKYIIFLSDADKLFDLALGMYNFPLVLMIAQHSQKDPREYLPFLRELQKLDKFYQRFKIDEHLGKHQIALENLCDAGGERFDEVVAYTKKHDLYDVALSKLRGDTEKHKVLLEAHAAHLFDKKEYQKSGLLYVLAGKPQDAIRAYVKAHAWREVFPLALGAAQCTESEVKEMAYELAGKLANRRHFDEAAAILRDYAQDVEASVQALCDGLLFAEALRMAPLLRRADLVLSVIQPATLDMASRMADDMDELEEQITKQVQRLAELKEKRDATPDAYFLTEDFSGVIDNVEVLPDGMSDAGTAFTRYTVAPTSMVTGTTAQTRKTSKSKRKEALRRSAGKKGTVFEETYLLKSLKKSVEEKVRDLQNEAGGLLPILVTFQDSEEHLEAASSLQSTLEAFLTFVNRQLEAIWAWRELEWQAEQMQEQEDLRRGILPPGGVRKEDLKEEEGREKISRPVLPSVAWQLPGIL